MGLTTILPIIALVLCTLLFGFIKEPILYQYQCHRCRKKFKESDLTDLKGLWHTKDWTCPHCKHQNVTLKHYNH